MVNAEIVGWGKCLPPAVLSNADLETLTDTNDEWVSTRTGIKERRISHVATSDLGAVAGLRAIAAAGLAPDDIDLVIVATCTGDSIIPATAAIVQDKMGCRHSGAFDLNAACSGFVYALVVATNMIKAGTHQTVVVVGAEQFNTILDFTDRSTAVLFGDGAGAVVLQATEREVGVLGSELGMDGAAASILEVPVDGVSAGLGRATPTEVGIKMNGPEVFRRAVMTMGEAVVRVLESIGMELADVDILIPHQANVRIIEAAARRLDLDDSKVFVNIGSYGNTSAATIPIAITEALEAGKIGPGDTVAFTAFGAGLSWGAAVAVWGDRVHPLAQSDAGLEPFDGTALDLLQRNLDYYGTYERTLT